MQDDWLELKILSQIPVLIRLLRFSTNYALFLVFAVSQGHPCSTDKDPMERLCAFQPSAVFSAKGQRASIFLGAHPCVRSPLSVALPPVRPRTSASPLRMCTVDASEPCKVDPSVWKSIFEQPVQTLKKRTDIKKILLIGAGVSSLFPSPSEPFAMQHLRSNTLLAFYTSNSFRRPS